MMNEDVVTTGPITSFDARVWAKAFVSMATTIPSIATDEGAMLAWFAGAIMRGYDEGHRKASESS